MGSHISYTHAVDRTLFYSYPKRGLFMTLQNYRLIVCLFMSPWRMERLRIPPKNQVNRGIQRWPKKRLNRH